MKEVFSRNAFSVSFPIVVIKLKEVIKTVGKHVKLSVTILKLRCINGGTSIVIELRGRSE